MSYCTSEFWYVVAGEKRYAAESFDECLAFLEERYGVMLTLEELEDCDLVGSVSGGEWRLVCTEVDPSPLRESSKEDWILVADDEVWIGQLGACLDAFAEESCHLESGQAEAKLLSSLYYDCLVSGKANVEVGEGLMLHKVRIYQDKEKAKQIFAIFDWNPNFNIYVRRLNLERLPAEIKDSI